MHIRHRLVRRRLCLVVLVLLCVFAFASAANAQLEDLCPSGANVSRWPTLGWTDTGTAFDEYDVWFSSDGVTFWLIATTELTHASLPDSWVPLAPGQTYYWAVSAGAEAEEVSFTVGQPLVELPNPRPNSAIAVPRDFSVQLPATDPTGTEYELFVTEVDPQDPCDIVWVSQATTTKDVGAETWTMSSSGFDITPVVDREPYYPAPPPSYTGLRANEQYLWRVDNNTTGEEGEPWPVRVPMGEPAPDARRVGVYVRFLWQEHPLLTSGVQEKMLLVDMDEGGGYNKNWVEINDQNEITGINSARVVKTYNPNGSGHAKLREFWHFDNDYQRLLPDERHYKWRILYCDNDGKPLYYDANGDDKRAEDGSEPFIWADGGDDRAAGWEFTTVPEVSDSKLIDADTEALVVYHESMYGTGAIDPEEGDYTFRSIAEDLLDIHENVHHPDVQTVIVGTQELTASYGGLNNDRAQRAQCSDQAPWPDEITEFDGWYTMTREERAAEFDLYGMPPKNTHSRGAGNSLLAQDRYMEWTARALRALLQDAANEDGFGGSKFDLAWAEHLQYVVLLGDADRVAPSFYHHYTVESKFTTEHRWLPTDFFYSSQDDTAAPATQPHYQVSRIPTRAKHFYRTVDLSGEYAPEEPFITKIRRYALGLDSESAKEDAFNNWFGRAAVVSGGTEYWAWHQFFPGVAQKLLSDRVDIGGGQMRDTFSGIKVRQYNIWGKNEEALNQVNVLRHLSEPTADSDEDVGFVYFLGEGDYWTSLAPGDAAYLTPTSALQDTSFDREWASGTPHGQLPLLVSCAALINRYDNALWGNDFSESFGEAAMLAEGGPIGVMGFASSDYQTEASYTTEYPDAGSYTRTINDSPGVGIDDKEGHSWPVLNQGVLGLEREGDPDAALRGKIELMKLIAREYALSTGPGMGDIFYHALDEYVDEHSAELTSSDRYEQAPVASTLFGATLFGDSALFMPHRQRATNDVTRPDLTDDNPRADAPQYNWSAMPIHTIPDGVDGVDVDLTVRTSALQVRVRVLTPFLMNTGYTSGYWHDESGTHWTTTDLEVGDTVTDPDGTRMYEYEFTARTPSIYLVAVQAQNPAWTQGVAEEWHWLKERWIYIQTVNQFVPNSDYKTLVVDMDQHDRYMLNGHTTSYAEVEDYYVNPALDGTGFNPGDNPRDTKTITFPSASASQVLLINPTFQLVTVAGGPPAELEIDAEPALPVLSNEQDPEDYRYQYWDTGVYHTLALNGEDIKDNRRYYGDLTPAALDSVIDRFGSVVVFDGDSIIARDDATRSGPHRYLFPYDSMAASDVDYLQSYLDGGGRLFVSNQTLSNEAANAIPFFRDLQEQYLGGITATDDTDYTNMDGLIDGTISELIQDVNIEGGTGEKNTERSGEVDPNGATATTVFTWDEASGAGTINSTGTAALHNRLLASGARTMYFPWPFEAIDHAGIVQTGESGRVNIMRLILEWLRSVPKTTNPSPANGAVDVPLNVVLEWSGVPESDGYEVYIGTYNQGTGQVDWTGPTVIAQQDPPLARYEHDPLDPLTGMDFLSANTRYYWRVDTVNPDGSTTTGDEWIFDTGTNKASNPDPADGATGVSADKVLSWSGLVDPTDPNEAGFYRLYLGTSLPLPATEEYEGTDAQYDPDLTPDEQYFWKVDSHLDQDDDGTVETIAEGDTWEFTTAATGQAFNPDPADGATGVPVDKTLSWSGPTTADTYDIFLGEGSLPGTATATGLTTAQYTPAADLTEGATYYWRVDVHHTDSTTTTGVTWTFTVEAPGAASNPSPADGATDVSLIVLLSWSGQADSYDVYFGAGSVPGTANITGLTSNFWFPGSLTANTTYYWRVDSHVGAIVVTGAVWSFTTGTQTTPDEDDGGGGGGGGGGCFIATSAMEATDLPADRTMELNCTGQYILPADRLRRMNLIRGLRDEVLMQVKPGRQFSAWYYALGPYAARAVRHREPAKAVVRGVLLRPLAGLSEECLKREQQ